MKKLYTLILVITTCITTLGQAKVTGLGTLLIGKTRVQDLNAIDFTEYDQSAGYGKQYTVCDKVKIFDAPTLEIAGLYLSSVRLKFYDDILYEISCDFDKELKAAFILKYGKGMATVRRIAPFCKRKEKFSTVYNVDWINGDIRARSAFTKWYNFECEYEEQNSLFIESLKMEKPLNDCANANSSSVTNAAITGLKRMQDSINNIEKERIRRIKKEL